jgi:hypothetical protein
MNISDIQLIRIGLAKHYKFDESFSTPTLFVSSEHEIRTKIITKPLTLLFHSGEIDPDCGFIFQIDAILQTWTTTNSHHDSVYVIENVKLMKTSTLQRPRIGVFMSDNRALQPDLDTSTYHSQVSAINYAYCLKHSYDFIYYRPYLDTKESYNLYNCIDPHTNEARHAAWSKLLSTLDMFNQQKQSYDYIVYIDSDCMFKDFNKRIEEFCPQMFTHDILFLNNLPWNDNEACSGFFICKNSELALSYIRDWYAVNLPEKNKVHAYEQDALWTIYKSWKSCYVMNSWMFREQEGQFLRHVCHFENDLRSVYFKQFIELHCIDYSKIVCDMPKKDLNTRNVAVNLPFLKIIFP